MKKKILYWLPMIPILGFLVIFFQGNWTIDTFPMNMSKTDNFGIWFVWQMICGIALLSIIPQAFGIHPHPPCNCHC